MEIGILIKQARESRGLTTFQLSNKIGTSETLIKRIEDGSADPSIGTLQRICEVLEIGLTSLLDGVIESIVIKEITEQDKINEWTKKVNNLISAFQNSDEFKGEIKLVDFKIEKYIADLSNQKYFKGYIAALKESLRIMEE